MNREYHLLAVFLLVMGGPLAMSAMSPSSWGTGPANHPPFVKAEIPDFTVNEGATNLSMKDIDLFDVFGDPDFPPFGNDNLTFSVDNTTFPAVIVDSKLTFGQAPVYPGKDNTHIVVTVTATDKSGETASTTVNITVININHAPVFYEKNTMIEIFNDVVSYYDLHNLFYDPDNDVMNFAYLGGAPANLTVEISPNGTLVLKPVRSFSSDQEVLRFKAIDPVGANATCDLMVKIIDTYEPPRPLPGSQVPDPLEQIEVKEGEYITFRVAYAADNDSSVLHFNWSIEDVEEAGPDASSCTWQTGFSDAGQHIIICRISDGIGYADAEWNITVDNVNRPPVVNDVWPLNNTEISYNMKITFRANATDPDGDPMTFYWRESDGMLLKTQTGVTISVFSKVLSPGKWHIIVLEIQDNHGGVTRQYIYIKVTAKPMTRPPSECASLYILIAPVMLSASITVGLRKRR